MRPGGTPVCSEIVRRPAAMASDGSSGVEGNLKTSSCRFTSKTKSVKVPPVSTPTRTARSGRGDLVLVVLVTMWDYKAHLPGVRRPVGALAAPREATNACYEVLDNERQAKAATDRRTPKSCELQRVASWPRLRFV